MRIYVGNFAYEKDEPTLREMFEAHGQVQEVSIVRDRDTGRSKGFAFVEMPTSAEAQAAIAALNGKEFDGRTITVNEARPRPERSFGGGSPSGFVGRGGGGGGGAGGGGGFRDRRAGGGGFQNARKARGGGSGKSPRW